MTILRVHLSKITNLTEAGLFDEADPYVKFELERNNVLFDDDCGERISSKKTNERNPVYSEDFTFDVPTLENMELSVKILDADAFSDETLGRCLIKLEDLDLTPEPLEVRRKIRDRPLSSDAWIHLAVAYGEPVEDADAAGALSRAGGAAYEVLRTRHAEHRGRMWNVTRGRVAGGSLYRTPREAFPGGASHPEGHDDWFPEALGSILSRTKIWADVCSLGPPDGKFMKAFKNALGVIAESAEGRDAPVVIRMMFGNILGSPTNCNAVRDELTSDLSEDANIRIWVGAWRRGASWNHSKIIAVDGKYLHTGGHNLWDAHYLDFDPVHDVSLELEGECALDGHKFANKMWDFVKTSQETFWGTIGSCMPDHVPQAAHTRVHVSEWPVGAASEHAPCFRSKIVEELSESVDDAIPIITMGRHGTLVDVDRPSDDAFAAMMDSARTVIRMALQDLGPVCLGGTKIALPGTGWPKLYFSALGRAMYERGVDVEIVLSNPRSVPAGLPLEEGQYGNGWDANDVSSEIIKQMKRDYPDAEDEVLREKVSSNLRVCFIREECGNAWEDGMTMGLHSKHFIVDDVVAYIGSQNLYVCDLAEWGVLIDDEATVKRFMEEYWNPMWHFSYTGEDVDVDAVMDGLDIDRDGGDTSDLDDETREAMKVAELANWGRAKLDVYDHDED